MVYIVCNRYVHYPSVVPPQAHGCHTLEDWVSLNPLCQRRHGELAATFETVDDIDYLYGLATDNVDILEAVQSSSVDYQKVHIQGMLDDSMVVNAGYDRVTVDGMDFDTVVVPEVWDARDSGPGLIER